MAMSISPKLLTLNEMLRIIWCIEVGDGSFFCIFHALSFKLNFFVDQCFPLTKVSLRFVSMILAKSNHITLRDFFSVLSQ